MTFKMVQDHQNQYEYVKQNFNLTACKKTKNNNNNNKRRRANTSFISRSKQENITNDFQTHV